MCVGSGRTQRADGGRSRVYRGGMSDAPFGFGLPDRDPDERDESGQGGGTPDDPFGLAALFGSMGGPGGFTSTFDYVHVYRVK